jgi:hypothetical protein
MCNGSVDIMAVLVKAGANAAAKSKDGKTPAGVAKDKETRQAFDAKVKVKKDAPLLAAATSGDEAAARAALAHGADPKATLDEARPTRACAARGCALMAPRTRAGRPTGAVGRGGVWPPQHREAAAGAGVQPRRRGRQVRGGRDGASLRGGLRPRCRCKVPARARRKGERGDGVRRARPCLGAAQVRG